MNLNSSFLNKLGLDKMPEDQKQAFLVFVYEQLEERVGEKISNLLSEAKKIEFNEISRGNKEAIENFLSSRKIDYKEHPLYKQLLAEKFSDNAIKLEIVSSLWLEENAPNYKEIVVWTMKEIEQDIIKNKEEIINGLN